MLLQTQDLSRDLLEQVLSRLKLSDRPAPTLDGLQTLYAAWCRKVPFDNVQKLIHLHVHTQGPLPGDDPAEFLTAWLTYGTEGPVGPATEHCTPSWCRWVLVRRVGLAPCSWPLRRHRTTARCWSPVRRPAMSSMPRSYTAPRCPSTSPPPQVSPIQRGVSTAASVRAPGISDGDLSIDLPGWTVALNRCR